MPTSTPTSAPALPSEADLRAVVDQMVIEFVAGAGYGFCGADPSTLASCPYSQRLQTRLRGLTGINFCRCQNTSTTKSVTFRTGPSGNHALLALFDGRFVFDLTIVTEGARLVVDDQSCAGRPNTSIYTDPVLPC